MLCRIFKYKISTAVDKGCEPDELTLKHIAKCGHCRAYYQKMCMLGDLLEQTPDAGPQNYDVSALGDLIRDRLDKTISGARANQNKKNSSYHLTRYARVATVVFAFCLGITVLSNMPGEPLTKVSDQIISFISDQIGDTGNWSASHQPGLRTGPAIKTSSSVQQPLAQAGNIQLAGSPQMVLLYQLSTLPYESLASVPYREQYEQSKAIYTKTSEITEKSAEVLTALAQSSLLFLRPF